MPRLIPCSIFAFLMVSGCDHRQLPREDGAGSIDASTGLPDSQPPGCTYQVIGGPTTLSQSAQSALTPSVVLANNQFGASWVRSSTQKHPEIMFRIADSKTTPLGDIRVVGPEAHTWAELAHDGKVFGICWQTDIKKTGRIGFRRFSSSGSPMGGTVDLNSTLYRTACTDLIATPTGWAAVLRGDVLASSGGAHRYALLLMDSAGVPGSSPVKFFGLVAHSTPTSLVFTGKSYLIAYRVGDRSSGKIVVQRFTSSGTLAGPPLSVGDAKFPSSSPKLIWTGSKLVVVYRQHRGADEELLAFQALDALGKPGGPPILVTKKGLAHSIDAMWTGAEIALSYIWTPYSKASEGKPSPTERIMLARVKDDGARLQPSDVEVVVGLHNTSMLHSSVSGSPSMIGLVWQQVQGSTQKIQLATVGCAD